jgi:hypothetical protein
MRSILGGTGAKSGFPKADLRVKLVGVALDAAVPELGDDYRAVDYLRSLQPVDSGAAA